MERSRFWRLLTISLLGLIIVSCANVLPIRDVDSAPIVTGSGKPPPPDAVQKAIVRAGSMLNMRMSVVRPGVVQAIYAPRSDFTAVMEITYDAKTYNIHYKSSEGLSYDPGPRTIHKNYNTWVSNLQKRIDNELLTL
jgi:hypothetical protein